MKFMRAEADRGSHMIPIGHFKARVLAATKISEGSYRAIAKDCARIESGESTTYSSPDKKRERTMIVSSLSMAEETLRRIVHNFYVVDKKRPSVKDIYRRLEESHRCFNGGESSLRKVLLKLGFRWKRADDKRKILFESSNIRLKRIKYLRMMSNFRKQGRPIVYLDETYLVSSHNNSAQGTKLMKPIDKDSRLIVIHAGGEMGAVKDALFTLTGRKYGNYHDDITEEIFFKWAKTQLLPNLLPRSVIVLDNASYHNVKIEMEVNSDSIRTEMTDWLNSQNIRFDASWTKVELYNLIKAHKKQESLYKLDVLLGEHGHAVLRLPLCHPELSVLQHIWASVKDWVGTHNTTLKVHDVEYLVRQKFDALSIAEWGSVCDHVKQLEEDYMQREHLLEQANDEQNFFANAGSSDESDTEMDSDFNSDVE